MEKLNTADIIKKIKQAKTNQELSELKTRYLGRKGALSTALAGISSLPAEERKSAGYELNLAKKQLEQAFDAAEAALVNNLVHSAKSSQIDLTAPVVQQTGHLHPLTQVTKELVDLFSKIGFVVADGPEVEDHWHNFDALNIPADHPARDMQDTFYLAGGEYLPRTHTSPVQIRYMTQNPPPIRIIAPGKVYRNEDEDARHVWMFQQLEGLVVDENINMSHLKGTLLFMARGIFGPEASIRLRPSFFPYTEPSVEVDATCMVCRGKGCNTCSGTGWIELLGAGMVHPKVLKNVGIDPEKYSGFAFGVGIERLAVIKYQIPDIRQLWRPNLRFLEQF